MRINLFDKLIVLGLLLISSLAAAQITVNTNFDPRTNQPIDIRDTLTFLADTSAVTWTYPGLVAYAADSDQFWYYTGSFWKRVVQDPFFSNLQDVDTVGIDVYDIAQWDGSNWVMTSPVELIGDGGGAYGSGLAGRTAYWLDDSTLVHTAITYSSTELNASALTGSLLLPKGTTAQQPVGVAGQLRHNTSTGELEWYSGSAFENLSYYFTKSGANVSLKDYNGTFTIPLSGPYEFRFNSNNAQFYNGTNTILYLSLGYNGGSSNDTGVIRLGGGSSIAQPAIDFYQTSNKRAAIGYDMASTDFDNAFVILPGNSSTSPSTRYGVGWSNVSNSITQRFWAGNEGNKTFAIEVARTTGTTTALAHHVRIQAGAPRSGDADLDGGELTLRSGVSTGSGSSWISFYTATPGGSGTTDRSPSEKVRITGTGTLAVGTTSPDASATMQVESTTQGFLPPRMTTVQRDAIGSPAAGLVIFNTTTTKLECFDGATWQAAW